MEAVSSAEAEASALSASTTWREVLLIAADSFVARLTTTSLPVTFTESGLEATSGFTSATLRSLPPSEPNALEDT